MISLVRMKIRISSAPYLGQGQDESGVRVGEIQVLIHTSVDELP